MAFMNANSQKLNKVRTRKGEHTCGAQDLAWKQIALGCCNLSNNNQFVFCHIKKSSLFYFSVWNCLMFQMAAKSLSTLSPSYLNPLIVANLIQGPIEFTKDKKGTAVSKTVYMVGLVCMSISGIDLFHYRS